MVACILYRHFRACLHRTGDEMHAGRIERIEERTRGVRRGREGETRREEEEVMRAEERREEVTIEDRKKIGKEWKGKMIRG